MELDSLDILCKVVDNFGDIGVVYRLARSISARCPSLGLRIVMDGLSTFQALEPSVDPNLTEQVVHGWRILDWNTPAREILERPAPFVIETFACGRPDWYDDILHSRSDTVQRTVVNIEYLTAEPFAEEFHLTESLTRSPWVKKYMFMPGFTEKTGGLIRDPAFETSVSVARTIEGKTAMRTGLVERLGIQRVPDPVSAFWIPVFGYERDFSGIVSDLAVFAETRSLLVLAASGRSQSCLQTAWEQAGKPFPLVLLPFLPQPVWDVILLASDFSIVRGEESFARAALSGHPFLWHAYPQENAHHKEKIKAFLELIRPRLPRRAFTDLETLYYVFNDREAESTGRSPVRLLPVLEGMEDLNPGFKSFQESLLSRPDMTATLLTFMAHLGYNTAAH